jgi:hypothetical protein
VPMRPLVAQISAVLKRRQFGKFAKATEHRA